MTSQPQAPATPAITTIYIGGRAFPLPIQHQPRPRQVPAEYVQAWETVNRALQADRYRVIAKLDNPTATNDVEMKNYGNFCYGKARAKQNEPNRITQSGAFEGFTSQEMSKELYDMTQRDNDKRYGHYICPLSSSKHYILIDDCNTVQKQQIADKYNAALILTSSPNNQQRIIAVDKYKEDDTIAHNAANMLSQHLNKQCGDEAVKNGEQDWRFPAFYNHKQKHIQQDGTSPKCEIIEARGGSCTVAQEIYNRYVAELLQSQQTQMRQRGHEQPVQQPVLVQQPQPSTTAAAAPSVPGWAPCGVLWRDVYAAACKQIAHGYARRGAEPPAGHRLDYVVAVRLAVMGYGQSQIAAAIASGAPAAEAARIRTARGEAPDIGRDWNAYAVSKAGEAFTAQGQAQVGKYADKASAWRREEARDAQTIQRAYERAGIEIPAEHKHQQTPQAKQKGMEM